MEQEREDSGHYPVVYVIPNINLVSYNGTSTWIYFIKMVIDKLNRGVNMLYLCLFEIKKRINYYTKNPLGLTREYIVMKKTVSRKAVACWRMYKYQ